MINRKNLKDFIEEITLENYEWVRERRREYLEQKIKIAEKMYLINYLAGHPTDLKKRDKMAKELYNYDNPQPRDYEKAEDISEEDIARAREYPLDNLIEFKNGSALCLWHAEKTSSLKYWKKQNIAHCFGCSKTVDSIEAARFLYNYSFPEAVNYLKKL